VNIVLMKILDQGGGGHHGHAHGGDDHGHSHDVFKLFKAMVAGSKKKKAPAAAGKLAEVGSCSSDHGAHGHAEHGHAEHGHEDGHHGHAHGGSGAAASCSGGHGHQDDEEKGADAHGHAHGSGGGEDKHGHAHGEAGEGDCDHGEHGSDDNINVRAAFIHAVGDLVQSVGVMIAAIVIWVVPDAHIADPICTFLFSILVLFTTFGVMRTAFTGLLNSVPPHINLVRIARALQALPGVSNVHDLHIWGYGTDRVALTVHLVADAPDAALEGAQRIAAAAGIAHSTVQTERCGSAEVANCYAFNEHVGACRLALTDGPAGAGGGHGHVHGAAAGNGGAGDSYAALEEEEEGGGGRHGHSHASSSRPGRSGSMASVRSPQGTA